MSVGAHIAAKLALFYSDERTLTDELCDMLCIWFDSRSIRTTRSLPFGLQSSAKITISKTTVPKESKNGSDLRIGLSSPLGRKEVLIQAKVLDPVTKKLRCDSNAGWEKLRVQLVKARVEVGELAFMMIYVPGTMLNARVYGYNTFEQQFYSASHGSFESCYGVTLVPVNKLLDDHDQWIDKVKKVPTISPGVYSNGLPFWLFVLKLVVCQIGSWVEGDRGLVSFADNPSYHTLNIGFENVEPADWHRMQELASEWFNGDMDSFMSQSG